MLGDQAQRLREIARKAHSHGSESARPRGLPLHRTVGHEPAARQPNADETGRCRVIAVTSGKGGVGKTNFAVNLSLALAASGASTVLLDADLGLANVDIVLGQLPRYTLDDVISGNRRLAEVLMPAGRGLQVVAGGSGVARLANLSERELRVFVEELEPLGRDLDFLVIDTGAGLSRNVLAFVLAAREVVLVTTPEPTAVADAYGMVKVIASAEPETRIYLMANRVRGAAEAGQVHDKLSMVAKRFLGVGVEFLGYLPEDEAVARAVRQQEPFFLSFPNSKATAAVIQMAASLQGIKESESNLGLGSLVQRLAQFVRRT